jgi:glycosyltransferase involved in cell wall biosynthesis
VYTLEAIASRCSDVELFQNPEDLDLMERLHLTRRARLLGNGIDLGRFDASRVSTEERRRLRAEFGADDDTVVVGAVGRLVVEKGFEELFDAVAALDERRYLLVVAGSEDPEKRDALRQSTIEAARQLGVVFLGHRPDIERVYAALDVFALPSHREGFPRAAMEAQAMSVPVVATNIRGCRQVVADGRTGLLVAPRDVSALARAIAHLGDNRELRARMGAAGRARALVEFDEQRVVERVHQAYIDVARRKGLSLGDLL